jgi:TonB family protein
MNRLKLFFTVFIIVAAVQSSLAQDTAKKASDNHAITSVKRRPIFDGGTSAFNKYIIKNLKYPEVAKIIRLSGKVIVSFMVDSDGSVKDAKPVNCLGAGCESEAVNVISSMPKWTPGIKDGMPVRVQYWVPINFFATYDDEKIITPIRRLRNSDYGFLFYIKGKTYTLDEAQAILGKSFDPSDIISVENYDDPKYSMPDKKSVYLLVMRNN